jgi:hypothetical protein
MSGSTLGGIVGAVVGFYVGGPAGAQYGWMIGAAVGGYVDPQQIKAPSIGDAQQQSSQPGIPRPVIYGHPAPFAGNIIDGESKARKIKVKEQQGKGGPVVESERFLLTSAVRICEGPVKVLRIWRNGEVVYDARDTTIIPGWSGGSPGDALRYLAQVRAKSSSFQNKVRIYEGTEDQLPDPALEAIHGVGNAPYYRGTAYIVIENDDVTDTRGAAAQYRFEVAKAGTLSDAATVVANGGGTFSEAGDSFAPATPHRVLFSVYNTDVTPIKGVFRVKYTSSLGSPTRLRVFGNGGMLWDSGWIGDSAYDGELAAIVASPSVVTFWDAATSTVISSTTAPGEMQAATGLLGHAILGAGPVYSGSISIDGISALRIEIIHPSYSLATTAGQWKLEFPDQASLPEAVTYLPENGGMLLGSDGLLYRASWMGALSLDLVTPDEVVLATVVDDVADRCGVPGAKIDTAALTDLIPGFLVAEQFTGADCLRPTQQAYFYDLPEVDGAIRAVKRGAAAVATVTEDDLVETDDRDERVRPQAIEYPLKVSVVTQDPAAEYAATPQTSGRLSPDFPGSSEIVVQLPIPMPADDTAKIAHKLHKVIHSQAEGRIDLTLPEAFSRYVPSDAFVYRDRRWLIEEARYADGVVKWKAVYDRVSAYTSAATGQAARPPALPSSGLVGPSILAAMNLPRLRTADSSPGMYVAARGVLASWTGCMLQLSVDGGETFHTVANITAPAVIGSLDAAALPGDTTLSVSVRTGDELASATDAQLAARANGFALGVEAPEVGQFKTATETTADHYSLTDVSRGQVGTAAAAHGVGEPFVLLDSAVQFLPIDLSYAGRTLIFRPVTFGTSEADAPTYAVVYRPQFTTLNVEPYTTSAGDPYVDAGGSPYYRIT